MNWMKIDPYQQLDEASEPAAMRAAIEKAGRQVPVVRQSLDMSRFRGLSAEDTYSVLSYYALQQMLAVQRTLYEQAITAPLPTYVVLREPKG